MTETVTRHRGSGRDENGQLITATTETLEAFAVAPGAGHHLVQLGRDGEDIDATVYFTSYVDLINADELTVRGERYQIIVNEWRSPWTDSGGGLEVLCTRGQG